MKQIERRQFHIAMIDLDALEKGIEFTVNRSEKRGLCKRITHYGHNMTRVEVYAFRSLGRTGEYAENLKPAGQSVNHGGIAMHVDGRLKTIADQMRATGIISHPEQHDVFSVLKIKQMSFYGYHTSVTSSGLLAFTEFPSALTSELPGGFPSELFRESFSLCSSRFILLSWRCCSSS